MSFKVREVVQLKSGGPKMTVSTVLERTLGSDIEKVRGQWFGGRKLEDGVFPVVSLKAADDEDSDGRKR